MSSYLPREDAQRFGALQEKAYIALVCAGVAAFLICASLVGVQTNYLVNGLIEFSGSLFLLKCVLVLYRDKMVRGYHWSSTVFFMSWGYWNIYYYPSVGDWWSFTGGLFIVSINTFWLAQMFHYRKN